MLELTTKRLILRPIQITDADVLHHAIFDDPEVMRFGDGVQTKEWVRAWIAAQVKEYDERGYGTYAILEKNPNSVIGYCGLFHYPDVNGQAEVEIGYRLARSTWGNGYATEAARAVRDHALTALGMQRLIALIDPSNITSIRVAEKIGMRYEDDVMFEGYSHPDHVYALHRAG